MYQCYQVQQLRASCCILLDNLSLIDRFRLKNALASSQIFNHIEESRCYKHPVGDPIHRHQRTCHCRYFVVTKIFVIKWLRQTICDVDPWWYIR